MAFEGWPATVSRFYTALEADNSKVYWQANRAVYDEQGASTDGGTAGRAGA